MRWLGLMPLAQGEHTGPLSLKLIAIMCSKENPAERRETSRSSILSQPQPLLPDLDPGKATPALWRWGCPSLQYVLSLINMQRVNRSTHVYKHKYTETYNFVSSLPSSFPIIHYYRQFITLILKKSCCKWLFSVFLPSFYVTLSPDSQPDSPSGQILFMFCIFIKGKFKFKIKDVYSWQFLLKMC